MKKFSTNLAFVDLLFNLLVGFTSLLLLAFLYINPIADEGKIDPVTKLLVIMTWPDESSADIDVWMRGPDGSVCSYVAKDKGYMILERDDLGMTNDAIQVDDKIIYIKRNIESLSVTQLLKGEYVLNIHNYSHMFQGYEGHHKEDEFPVPVEIKLIQMNPFKILFIRKVNLDYRQEETVVTFEVTEKEEVVDMRTDIKIPLFYAHKRSQGGYQ
jgi:hypothetical protein